MKKEHQIELSDTADQLIKLGLMSISEYAFFKSLDIQKYRYGDRLAVVAPTWKMRAPILSLDDFLPDLVDPQKKRSSRRDFACIPGGTQRPFFQDPNILTEQAKLDRVCPINDGSGRVETGQTLYIDFEKFRPAEGALYAMAADLSVSGDCTGVSMVHYDIITEEFILDFSFQIIARGSRVDYEPIRQLARNIRAAGFRLVIIGFDQFQSNDSYIILEKEGFMCEIVKFADSLLGCNTLNDYISSGRFIYGKCDWVFTGEASELQVINDRRIDHLKTGGRFNSKDVWDSTVNALYLAMKIVKEQQADILTPKDIQFYKEEDFEVNEITTQETLLSPKDIRRRQLPNNRHALCAYVYCRYNAEKDSEEVAVALGAVSFNNIIKIIKIFHLHKSPIDLVIFIKDLVASLTGEGYYRTISTQSVEVFVPDMPFIEKVEEIAAERASHLSLTRSDVSMSERARIMEAQSRCRDGQIKFPENYSANASLRAVFHHMIAYPFVPKKYMLLALEGLSRESRDIDFTIPQATSRVIKMDMQAGDW